MIPDCTLYITCINFGSTFFDYNIVDVLVEYFIHMIFYMLFMIQIFIDIHLFTHFILIKSIQQRPNMALRAHSNVLIEKIRQKLLVVAEGEPMRGLTARQKDSSLSLIG